jgi:hypothetical protein
MACEPTAQPRRGPTIWRAPSDGTKSGSLPDDVGVTLGDAVGVVVGVGIGESVGDGDGTALGVGVGRVADAVVQPVRTTTTTPAAPNAAMRNGIPIQRQTYPTCAARHACDDLV